MTTVRSSPERVVSVAGVEDPVDPSAVVRAAAEVLVYAPLGLGVKLVEDAPTAVARVRQELSNARFIGRMTVNQGVAQVRSRMDADRQTTSVSRSGASRAVAPADPAPAALRLADTSTAVAGSSGDVEPLGAGPSADDLALPDYDTLPAIDIVAKLDTLTPGERSEIEQYESAHRQRRTVLGKLAQLAEQ